MSEGVELGAKADKVPELRGVETTRTNANSMCERALPEVGGDGYTSGAGAAAEKCELTAGDADRVHSSTDGGGRSGGHPFAGGGL